MNSFSRGISTCNVQWQFKHREWDKVYSSGPTQICSSLRFLFGIKLYVRQHPQQHLQPSFLNTINAIESRTVKIIRNSPFTFQQKASRQDRTIMMVIAFNISNPISLSRKANFKSWFTQGSERHAVVIYYWRINICSFLTTVTKSQIMNQVKLLLLIDKNCLDQYATCNNHFSRLQWFQTRNCFR